MSKIEEAVAALERPVVCPRCHGRGYADTMQNQRGPDDWCRRLKDRKRKHSATRHFCQRMPVCMVCKGTKRVFLDKICECGWAAVFYNALDKVWSCGSVDCERVAKQRLYGGGTSYNPGMAWSGL